MVLSRGLLISLGFTLLVGILLFMFIKQRTSSIENKINTLFQLVQEEAAKSHQAMLTSREKNMVVQETTEQIDSNELITVSDGESSDDEEFDDSEDSEIESSEDSESDEELITESKSSVVALEIMNQVKNNEKTIGNEENVKTIHLVDGSQQLPDITTIENIDNVDEDLGVKEIEEIDFDSDEDEDEDEENGFNVEEEHNIDIQVTKVASDNNADVINYKKLGVSKLRDIVKEKGLHEDPKSLKKAQLIELLEQ